jgi:hypothetical protein
MDNEAVLMPFFFFSRVEALMILPFADVSRGCHRAGFLSIKWHRLKGATHVASLAKKVRAGAARRPTVISEPLRWPVPFHGAWIFNFFINKNECQNDVTDRGRQRGGRPHSLSPE